MASTTVLKIVVDTNVIVAALIRAGIVREILLRHPGAFLTPATCMEEAWEKRGEWNRRAMDERTIREALDLLAKRVLVVVPRSALHAKEAEAARLIRDPDDVPVVALALSLANEGIWTFNTKDFAGRELVACVRVLTTGEVKSLLEGSG